MTQRVAGARFYPKVGKIFELTLDGDVVDPIAMGCYGKPQDSHSLRFTGAQILGKQTRLFTLVSVGHCYIIDEVRQKLVPHGRIPKGQWREALRAAYRMDDKG